MKKTKKRVITYTKMKNKKELITYFSNNFDNLKNDIENLFLNNYLTINLLLNIYNNITEDKAYEIKEKKGSTEKIKSKLLKIFEETDYKNFINELLEYKKSIEELNKEDSYFYNKIWSLIYNYGKKNNMFNYPKDADNFIEKYNIINRMKNELSIKEMIKLYNNQITNIDITEKYEEYVSITQRTNLSKITYILTFYIDNESFKIEASRIESFRL